MSKEKAKKPGVFTNITIFIFLVFALASSVYLIYNLVLLSSIETLIRYIVIGLLGLFDLFLIIKSRSLIRNKVKKKKKTGEIKKPKKWLFIIMLLIYSIICAGVAITINYLYSKIDNVKTELTTNTYIGMPGGRSEGYFTDIQMPPPFLLFTTGRQNIR